LIGMFYRYEFSHSHNDWLVLHRWM
jgi:hypothetical protein